jgi:hypothetical protein
MSFKWLVPLVPAEHSNKLCIQALILLVNFYHLAAVAAASGAILQHPTAHFCVQIFSQMISFKKQCQEQQRRTDHVSMIL